ncbi:MAG: DnaJ domain-containing protein [Paludibaculum sp.]
MTSASVNYYDLLQIHPKAEPETIQRVYKIFAARYHPDNLETGDADRFHLYTRSLTKSSAIPPPGNSTT